MLKKAPDKFHDIKFHGAPAFTAGFLVSDKNIPTVNFDNATVGYGYLENIRRKIFDTAFAAADGLTVYVPVNCPDVSRYLW